MTSVDIFNLPQVVDTELDSGGGGEGKGDYKSKVKRNTGMSSFPHWNVPKCPVVQRRLFRAPQAGHLAWNSGSAT